MRIVDRLERKIGWFAVRNLIVYIVAGNALVWLVGFIFQGNVFADRLALIPSQVFKGEVWRVFTFLLLTSFGSSPISAILELYFIYMIGRSLEADWGSFRLTLYYFIGFFLTVAISLATGMPYASAGYIHLSLFFAFAMLAPDMQILLFFFIPVKVKWLAWLSAAFMAFGFVIAPHWVIRLYILAPLVAFALFFGQDIAGMFGNNRRAYKNKSAFRNKLAKANVVKVSFHKCEICGVTENDSPDAEFRYCSKCAGDHEFCMEHLGDHNHFLN